MAGNAALPDSEDALELRGNYRQSASAVRRVARRALRHTDREAKTPSGELYKDFKEWCERAGIEKVPTQTAFGRSCAIASTSNGRTPRATAGGRR
jgi:phage/plasmid-associated DNA primase